MARVKPLAAIAPVAAAGTPLGEGSRRMFTTAATYDAEWLAIARMLTSARLSERWYEAQARHLRENVRPEAALGFLRFFFATNFAAEMAGLPMPGLAILGRHDFMAFTDDAMRQSLGKRLPSLMAEVVESAGITPCWRLRPAS